jgi:hypothetical protein
VIILELTSKLKVDLDVVESAVISYMPCCMIIGMNIKIDGKWIDKLLDEYCPKMK